MPKTQSALLEAMAEQQVTVDGVTRALPDPFLLLATENPIEYEGTFPLPEAQLDRFFLKTALGYPARDEELRILGSSAYLHPLEQLGAVVSVEDVLELRAAVRDIYIDEIIRRWIVDLVRATRELDAVAMGASVRGSLALERAPARGRCSTGGLRRARGRRAAVPPGRRAPARVLGRLPRRAAHAGAARRIEELRRQMPRARAAARARRDPCSVGRACCRRRAAVTFPLVPRGRLIGLSFGTMRSLRRGRGSDVVGSRPYRPATTSTRSTGRRRRASPPRADSDEFIVREHYADEAPRVVIACDRRPAMSPLLGAAALAGQAARRPRGRRR